MKDNLPSILIVDDEQAICDLVSASLTAEGYVCDVATNVHNVYEKLETYNYDVVLLDIRLPEKSGVEILKAMQECCQKTSIVMMTAVQDLEIAIETMKLGASDYITKPFTLDKLNLSVRTALKKNKTCSEISDRSSIEPDVCINDCEISLNEINAIARGIEAQVDYFDSHSRIVTQKTVDVAKWLGLPDKDIRKWVSIRKKQINERNNRIKSMLYRLERNIIAQIILGLTKSVRYFPLSKKEQN